MEEHAARRPGTFKFWDQGIVTYLLFKAHDEKRLSYAVKELQVIPSALSRQEAVRRLGWDSTQVPEQVDSPCVVHFCGRKPLLQHWRAYSAPFTAFRLMHYHRFHHGAGGLLGAWARVLREEASVLASRARRRVGRVRARAARGLGLWTARGPAAP